jgi:hypothetical protein
MSDLKRQAEKMGLQVGRNVAIYQVIHRNQTQKEYKKKYEANSRKVISVCFYSKTKRKWQYRKFSVWTSSVDKRGEIELKRCHNN